MIQHQLEVGNPGIGIFAEIEIRDKTDSPANTAECCWNWYPGLPGNFDVNWKYKIDSGAWSANTITTVFGGGGGFAILGTVYVGYAQTLTFHINSTTDPNRPGPYEITATLYRGSNLKAVLIPVGGTYKRAIPYVKDGGVWKLAEPYVKILGEWKTTN